jgi:hypothetical protein
MRGLSNPQQVAWVAAGLRRSARDAGVELPVSYSHRVAADALAFGPELGVSRLGAGVVIHTCPRTTDRLPIVLGYADNRGQWHRDGSRHLEETPAPDTVAVEEGAAL